MLLNLLLLAAEALPAGGEIGVSGDADDLVVALAGPRAAWPQGLPACLADPAEAWRALHVPRRLQLGLVALLAPRLGCRISLLMTPGAPGGALPLRLSRL
jgi:hypothetical protein